MFRTPPTLHGLVDGSRGQLGGEGVLFREEGFTDLDFANNEVIFAENMQSLVESLGLLYLARNRRV